MFYHRNRQRRAFYRVRACAQLVKQDQAAPIGLLQNPHNVRHMSRERRKTLLNTLLVADIRQNPFVDGYRALVRRRNVQPALGHKRQQAQGFQGNRLAAGIRTGNHQGIKGVAQLQVNRHRLFRVQQGVSGPAQTGTAVPPDLRPHAVHFIAQFSPCENQVQMDQRVIVPLNIFPVGRRIRRQLRQNPFNFFLLLRFQLNVFVIRLNNAHRFHKKRRARGGNIVNKSRKVALLLSLYGHHKAAVPLGDDGLLQNLCVTGGRNNFL